ncbi:SWR1-complex protein [Lachnellula hyalina]|uniref:SWR1-complex protein 4 n=1 Tax=Lachnellula hyalina TaxID=1316788 RepID=A0A8H8TWF1_9HELO|nr:SWR1-complex protein [Lachnellula hyalina]TVY24342.1 SWR1-complex protein [Lachnellula hyalina]
MSSNDVRDMLDLPDSGSTRPAKKQKLTAPRPVLKGLAREIQNLSGDNPIAIVPEVSAFKKKRYGSRKPVAKWEQKPFKNSARDGDPLVLRHWRRKEEKPPAPPVGEDGNVEMEEAVAPIAEEMVEDSTFAKYNVRVNVPEYTEEEYNAKLQNQDWTKLETDHLVGLAYEYDLRWPVIWDRYEPPLPAPDSADSLLGLVLPPKIRTVEDLKARYYSVAATMMAERKPPIKMNSAEFNLHEVMSNFNPAIETARKKFAEAAFQRTKEEAREEESLLLELKRILARSDKLNEERRELYARLEAPPSTGNIGIYSSSQGLQQLLQQLMQASKKRKSLMGSEGISPAAGPSQQASFERRDSSVRESISGPSGSNNNKKGPPPGPSERRQLTEEEEKIYGVSHHERIGASGAAFRHEKISKPLISKSSVQQTKIANVLVELEIPNRLIMPTVEVGEAYESLLQSINTLLDARKLADKLDGEIKLARQQKEEREKAARLERGEAVEGDEVEGNNKTEKEKSVARSVRGGSVARSVRGGSQGHKRSASVLSATSEQNFQRSKEYRLRH